MCNEIVGKSSLRSLWFILGHVVLGVQFQFKLHRLPIHLIPICRKLNVHSILYGLRSFSATVGDVVCSLDFFLDDLFAVSAP